MSSAAAAEAAESRGWLGLGGEGEGEESEDRGGVACLSFCAPPGAAVSASAAACPAGTPPPCGRAGGVPRVEP